MKNKSAFTAVSLFSGIGGMDIGLHRNGFIPLACCELDPNAFATLSSYMSRMKLRPKMFSNINDVDLISLKNELAVKKGEIDLLYGGPPCQSFSLIGKRHSLDDARGLLLFKMVEFAETFLPKVILIEQVKGLLSAPCGDNVRGGVLSDLLERFAALGYQTSYKVLLAADYGVPQLRERLFVVAAKGKKFNFPSPTHFSHRHSSLLAFGDRYRTVRDAIDNLPAATVGQQRDTFPSHIDITPKRDRERIRGVPEGECLAKQLHLPSSQRMRLTLKDTTKFRRLSWSLPSLTLRGGEAFYHPSEDRYLTPREYLRIHGFDDQFLLLGPIRARSGTFKNLDQHRLVANAVPPRLAEVVGREIVQQLLDSQGPKKTTTLQLQKHFVAA